MQEIRDMEKQAERMARAAFYTLHRGDEIIIRFGSHGTQYGLVHHWSRSGTCYVVKWRERSATWTQPVAIAPGEFVRRALITGPLKCEGPHRDRHGPVMIPADTWRLKAGQRTRYGAGVCK